MDFAGPTTYVGGQHEFIGYKISDKHGVLDLQGKPLTEALYDNELSSLNAGIRGNLIQAERGTEQWIINIKDGTAKKVDYVDMNPVQDSHMVATSATKGSDVLVDLVGNVVIAAPGGKLGVPSGRLHEAKPQRSGSCQQACGKN